MKTVHIIVIIISTDIRAKLMEYRDLSFFYMNLQVVFRGSTYIRENTVNGTHSYTTVISQCGVSQNTSCWSDWYASRCSSLNTFLVQVATLQPLAVRSRRIGPEYPGILGHAQMIAVDISGAFDRVSHVDLLIKAQNAGIGDNLRACLRDYVDSCQIQDVVVRTNLIHTQFGYPKAHHWDRRYSISFRDFYYLYFVRKYTCSSNQVLKWTDVV